MNKTRDHVRNYLLLGGIYYYFYNFTLTNLFYKNSVLKCRLFRKNLFTN